MKAIKQLFIIAVSFGILCGLASTVSAGGAGAENDCCVRDAKNLGGTIPLKATVGVHFDAVAKTVDATIRLERSGTQKFYRIRIVEADITADSDEVIFCKLFNPCVYGQESPNYLTINEVVNNILKDFFDIEFIPGNPAPAAGQLLLSDKSISDTDWTGDAYDRLIPNTTHVYMSIANASVYVELD